MKYNKLVRDKIPQIIRKSGKAILTHVASDEEYQEKLCDKLVEEAKEFSQDQSPKEMADVLEVIDAIFEHKKFERVEIEKVKRKRAKERGKFRKRIILEEVKR